jgi:hypothetical protein
VKRDAIAVDDQRSKASRKVVNRSFRAREVPDPSMKDTMIARTGQPALAVQPGLESGFSLQSSLLAGIDPILV